MKALMILADYFEDSEALVTRDLLLRGGDFVTTASVSDELDVTSQSGLVVHAVTMLKYVKEEDYDYLVIPGGRAVKEILTDNDVVLDLISSFAKKGKLIASICAAPSLLGKLGLLHGKKYTCFPGFNSDNFGGIYLPQELVVRDGNFIFGRAMYASFEFAREILGDHLDEEKLNKVIKSAKGL